MLKDFEKAVRQFQEALREAGIVGDVEVTLPREVALELHREVMAASVFHLGPLPMLFDHSHFCMVAPGGLWTFRHKQKPDTEPENFRALRLEVRALESELRHVRNAALEEVMNAIALLQHQRKMTHEQWDAGVRAAWDVACGLKAKEALHADVANIRATGEGARRGPISETQQKTLTEDMLPIRIHAADIPAAKRALAELEREDRLRRGLSEYEPPPLGNPPPYIVEERVAASINEALGYRVQNPNLEESLGVLQNKAQFGVLAGSAAALVQASIRDAALEDAAQAIACAQYTRKMSPQQWDWGMQDAQAVVRALKSKPAPRAHLNGCALDTNHNGDCVVRYGEYQGKAEPPEPLHDFGWALQQMRAGQKVRRGDSSGVFGPIFVALRFSYNDAILDADGKPAHLSHSDLRATDWEIAE